MGLDPTGVYAGPRASWDKAAWRRYVQAGRSRRGADRTADATRTDLVLALPEVDRARTVAAYVAFDTEPATDLLLAGLLRRGVRVLVPVLLPDRDLDWACWAGPGDLVDGLLGLYEPPGTRLGITAVASVDVLVCPGLAVDPSGTRLGRGGGSYDRALARTRPDALRVLLLDDAEVVDSLPAELHDEPVHVAVTSTRAFRLRRPGR